jgi:hypothetical protein
MTLKTVNKALAERLGPGIELIRGRGYFYFAGWRTEGWANTSVMVAHLRQLTVEQWIREAEVLIGFETME